MRNTTSKLPGPTGKSRFDDQSRKGNEGYSASLERGLEPGGGGRPRGVSHLELSGDSYSDCGRDRVICAGRGRRYGYRQQGDVHVRRSRRYLADSAAGGDRIGDARLYRAPAGSEARLAKAVLHGPDVPAQ